MLDVSDGLLRDGNRLAASSSVILDLDPQPLKQLAEGLEPASMLLGADPTRWVLAGGEDHGLLATFPPGVQLPPGFTAIGSVQVLGDNESPGIKIAGHAADTGGWDHFAH
jgi:thiamine-monophosphate kinase